MNIENLTIGEAMKIANMFSGLRAAQSQTQEKEHPFVGRFVICRCYSAGVHAGVLVSQVGDQAVLKDSRRLWQWTANDGVDRCH